MYHMTAMRFSRREETVLLYQHDDSEGAVANKRTHRSHAVPVEYRAAGGNRF